MTLRRWLAPALTIVLLPVVCVAAMTPAAAAIAGCPSAPYGIARTAPGSGKTVALTFDDGPGRDTGRIMAALAAAHVTATFFNLGVNEAGARAVVRAERTAGYALGDHTWDHQSLPSLGTAGQAAEMDRQRNLEASITGRYPCVFRPPYGEYDATTLSLAQQRHMRVWNWSVDTEDWKAAGSGDAFWINRITSRADAGGAQAHPVILMHNQPAGNPATVAALPRIISYYRTHGYAFVDVLGNTGPPTIRTVSPSSGKTSGGTRVTLTGKGFRGITAVTFGGAPGTALHVVSSTKLAITSPRHHGGLVAVHVITNHGTSPSRIADHYLYVSPPTITAVTPTSGPTAGGTRVRLHGAHRRPLPVRVATHDRLDHADQRSDRRRYPSAHRRRALPARHGCAVRLRGRHGAGRRDVLDARRHRARAGSGHGRRPGRHELWQFSGDDRRSLQLCRSADSQRLGQHSATSDTSGRSRRCAARTRSARRRKERLRRSTTRGSRTPLRRTATRAAGRARRYP